MLLTHRERCVSCPGSGTGLVVLAVSAMAVSHRLPGAARCSGRRIDTSVRWRFEGGRFYGQVSSSGVILARWWAPLVAAALSFSLCHTLVDWHIGLFGETSQTLSPHQAALAWVTAALYGWWGWSLASAAAGQRSYLASVVVLTVGWALAGNGLVIVACPPPCPGGLPHQDIVRVGSLVLGAVGGFAAWIAVRDQPGSIGWGPAATALGLLIAAFALEGLGR